ncbi:NADase-type glycan-binding domain-containing protein [Pseudarthrobacter sp. O4]|uniref:NADase-type glycan-binding domain-containing protein n=1 Tax=Pseudarthrobacter sp. O4 TaxID=3418417 RepID=UPI003CF1527D
MPAPPWWRRLLSRPQRQALPAGSRPKWRKPWRFPVRSVSLLAVVGLFGGAAYFGRDVIAAGVARVQDELGDSEEPAQRMTATSKAMNRGPELAIDHFSNRSWAAGAPGNVSAALEAGFDRPFRLSYVVISAGASNVREVFLKERRPVRVEITAIRPDGGQASRTVDLKDDSAPQSFYIGADQASAVRFKILDSTGPEGAPVSVAEVQFAGRR